MCNSPQTGNKTTELLLPSACLSYNGPVTIDNRCWLWRGGMKRNGYGYIRWNQRTTYAHRAVWEMVNGPIPPDQYVCHHCDTPACVNPSHLFLGTAADNVADMVKKGRTAKGERHSQSKLTGTQVGEIRALARAGIEQKAIAAQFGLRRQTVSRIVRGLRWPHIEGAISEDCRHFSVNARIARHR